MQLPVGNIKFDKKPYDTDLILENNMSKNVRESQK